LDLDRVKAKLAESEAVFGVLKDIFTAEPETRPVTPATAEGLWGLDPAHSALVRRLVCKPSWSRPEFEEIAGGLRLLPDGALETINDAAFEARGETLVEGDDVLEVRVELVLENAR
jgi:hypothetical protein